MKASKSLFGPAALAALVTFALGAPRDAFAQATDAERTAAAQALYEQATAEMDKKNFAKACPELEEVVRLAPTGVGAKITLGECYEGWDKLASAYAAFEIAAAAADKAGQADRSRKARDRSAALKPRLAWLTINVGDATRGLAGLEIKRDGILIGPGQWGVPIPVDKGPHTIIASATGRHAEHTVEIASDGATQSFTVDLNAVAPPTPTSAPTEEPTATPTTAPTSDSGASSEGMGGQKIAALAAGGVGVVGIVVGSIFGVQAISKKSASSSHCGSSVGSSDANICDDTGTQDRKDGISAGNVSTVFFIVGLAGVAGGVVLWATAPKKPSAPATGFVTTPRPRLEATAGFGTLGLRGTF